ncbi:MAG: hypothetical protein Q8J99_20065 [Sulfuritalea sp.]|nr:hypothetical protein [Sulfuritalea sp.]
MKRNTLLVLGTLCMTVAGGIQAATAAPATPAAASHDHHHGPASASLELNAGRKWETDAALRQAMAGMRQAVAASLHEIHENRASNQKYGQLAQKVEREVAGIVANCKLEPKADAQLHLIVAELLEGAAQMTGKVKKAKRQGGAVKVINALNNYAAYFDDAAFKPIAH